MGDGKRDCAICKGNGYITGKMGIRVKCSCVNELKEIANAKKELIKEEPICDVGEAVKRKAVELGYIPAHRINDEFDIDTLNKNVSEMVGNCGVKTSDFDEYKSLLSTILTELRVNRMPVRSYIIGGSNGFGKTTFVNTAIKIMMAYDRKVVPYKSLIEINDLMYEDYERAHSKLRREIKYEDESSLDIRATECKWKDFVEADLVMCYLTGIDDDCMWIEMSTLKRLLQLRGNKGKATIVMVAESLEWYRNNESVRKYILNEILETKNNSVNRYDKLIHKSVCLIDKASVLGTK